MLLTVKGQKPPSKEAASPQDAALRGVRLAVCEETAQRDVINEATEKKLTRTEVVTCRGLYKDYVTFEPMQLHLLCTNELHKPENTWDTALQGRIQIVHFPRRYFASFESGYTPSNPLHGQVDLQLYEKLTTPANLLALLIILVRAAVGYFADGQQILEMPLRSKRMMELYEATSDPLRAFILYSCVEERNAFIGTTNMLTAFNDQDRYVDGKRLGSELKSLTESKLTQQMRVKGFESKKASMHNFPQNRNGEVRGFKGLRLKTPVELAEAGEAN